MAGKGSDWPAKPSIAIVGFMAAGKSTIGLLLAQRLGMPFVDTDKAIEEAFASSVAEIFQVHGEPAFREAEREMLARLLADRPRVLALGGGAFLDRKNQGILRMKARTVWLNAPFEIILERLKGSNARPLALNRNEAELRALMAERELHYSKADVRVDIPDADPERVVDLVMRALQGAP